MDYSALTSYRKCGHEGVDELLWVTTDGGGDGGAWGGPLMDWIDESKDFMSEVKKFDTVVQAGGNCGMYARFYKNYFKDVYTFEPDDLNFYCLNINCQGEGYHKVKGGLGSKIEKLTLNARSKTNVGTHRIVNQPGDVQMYLIDDLNLNDCDLIHLDVEGYEETALKGAIATINRFKPVIITERSGGQNLLFSMGYKLHKRLRMDTVYVPR